MSNVGKLCHVKGGSALAYSKGGSALIFKSNPVGDVTVRVPWSPQSYTCNEFGNYHDVTFACNGTFTQGQGVVLEQNNGGTETVFKLRVTAGPAVFRIQTSCSMQCAANEDAGVKCRVLANQKDAQPQSKANVSAPRTDIGLSPTSTNVNFDNAGKLTGIS